LVPVCNGPVYNGILPDIFSLLLAPDFLNMVNPTQIVRPLQPVVYSIGTCGIEVFEPK
jgi:hypothetical protein